MSIEGILLGRMDPCTLTDDHGPKGTMQALKRLEEATEAHTKMEVDSLPALSTAGVELQCTVYILQIYLKMVPVSI